MASIDFYAGEFGINNLAGSGLGFFGSTFGASVGVGSWPDCTFLTNSNGTIQGSQVNNIKFLNSASGIVNSASSGIPLLNINNYLATLNVRFTHSSPVQCQNVYARIYDRSNINNPASGVTTKIAELINIGTNQTVTGSGDSTWTTITSLNGGSGTLLQLSNSPSTSGLMAGNGIVSTVTSQRHDWYLALSQSPDSIGSKSLNALFVSLEYL